MKKMTKVIGIAAVLMLLCVACVGAASAVDFKIQPQVVDLDGSATSFIVVINNLPEDDKLTYGRLTVCDESLNEIFSIEEYGDDPFDKINYDSTSGKVTVTIDDEDAVNNFKTAGSMNYVIDGYFEFDSSDTYVLKNSILAINTDMNYDGDTAAKLNTSMKPLSYHKDVTTTGLETEPSEMFIETEDGVMVIQRFGKTEVELTDGDLLEGSNDVCTYKGPNSVSVNTTFNTTKLNLKPGAYYVTYEVKSITPDTATTVKDILLVDTEPVTNVLDVTLGNNQSVNSYKLYTTDGSNLTLSKEGYGGEYEPAFWDNYVFNMKAAEDATEVYALYMSEDQGVFKKGDLVLSTLPDLTDGETVLDDSILVINANSITESENPENYQINGKLVTKGIFETESNGISFPAESSIKLTGKALKAYSNKGGELTYAPNGGMGVMVISEAEGDETQDGMIRVKTADEVGFTWGGHTLLGWASTPDAGLVEFEFGQKYPFFSDTTLYAVWGDRNSGSTHVKMYLDPTFIFTIPSEVILSNTNQGRVDAMVSIEVPDDGGDQIYTTKDVVMTLETASEDQAEAYKRFRIFGTQDPSNYAEFFLEVYDYISPTEKGDFVKNVTGNDVPEMQPGYIGVDNNKVLVLDTKNSEGLTMGKTEKYLEFGTAGLPNRADIYDGILNFKVATIGAEKELFVKVDENSTDDAFGGGWLNGINFYRNTEVKYQEVVAAQDIGKGETKSIGVYAENDTTMIAFECTNEDEPIEYGFYLEYRNKDNEWKQIVYDITDELVAGYWGISSAITLTKEVMENVADGSSTNPNVRVKIAKNPVLLTLDSNATWKIGDNKITGSILVDGGSMVTNLLGPTNDTYTFTLGGVTYTGYREDADGFTYNEPGEDPVPVKEDMSINYDGSLVITKPTKIEFNNSIEDQSLGKDGFNATVNVIGNFGSGTETKSTTMTYTVKSMEEEGSGSITFNPGEFVLVPDEKYRIELEMTGLVTSLAGDCVLQISDGDKINRILKSNGDYTEITVTDGMTLIADIGSMA